MLLIAGGDKDRNHIENKFQVVHNWDKTNADNYANGIEALDKNLPHQDGVNSSKSVLDKPFCATSLLQRVVTSPKIVRFKEYCGQPGLYRRTYELGFDEFIGRRYPSDPLNCKVAKVVLQDNHPDKNTQKNAFLVTFK